MADKLISQLDAAAALAAADLMEVEQGVDPTNTSGKITLGALLAFVLRTNLNVQTGTSYELVLSDAFKQVVMDNASANTVNVPDFATVAFEDGTRIDLGWDGVGQLTITHDVGVTIRTPETLKLRKRYSKASLIKRGDIGDDTWDLIGDLELVP